jgi:hypothetical protein
VFTPSNNSNHITIVNCRIENGATMLFGFFANGNYDACDDDGVQDFESDKPELTFIGNKVKNCRGGGLFNSINDINNLEVLSKINISNNIFDGIGMFYFRNNPNAAYLQGLDNSELNINNNTFINGSLNISGHAYINIVNNNFRYDENVLINPKILNGAVINYGNNGMICIQYCTRLTIDNNTIEGDYKTQHDDIRWGISILLDGIETLRDSLGNLTEYWYPQMVKISNNKISGFYRSINIGVNNYMFWQGNRQTVGWQISNNTIYQHPTWSDVNIFGAAIVVPPGAVCENNTIYASSVQWVRYIYAVGVNGGDNRQQRLLGAIVKNNTILDVPSGVFAMSVGDAGASEYNCIIKDNILTGGGLQLWDNAATNTYTSNNVLLSTTQLPSRTNPAPAGKGHYRENANQY